jgi:hypothetical protein
MWPGFDPDTKKGLDHIRRMVRLQRQTPTREWPLICVDLDEGIGLLVVREWPDGSVTAYVGHRTEP